MLGSSAGAPAGKVKDVTTASFKADVLAASTRQPVLVDFWAPWCGPCKQLAPVLEKAVADSKGKVTLVKMNIDDHPQIPGQLGIQSIPAVIAFDKGQPVDGFMGALPESQVRGFIERLVGPLGGGADAILAEAEAALGARRRRGRGGPLRAHPQRGRDPSEGDRRAGEIACRGGRSRPGQGRPLDGAADRAGQRPGPGDRGGLGRRASRRTGRNRRRSGPAPEGGRGKSRRPSGAVRPRGRARRQGRPRRRREPALGNNQTRTQMERGRRPQAAVAVLRSVGFDGPVDRRRASKIVGDLVLTVDARG